MNAPVGGLSDDDVSQVPTARVLDNFFPTQFSIAPRPGHVPFGKVQAGLATPSVRSLVAYGGDRILLGHASGLSVVTEASSTGPDGRRTAEQSLAISSARPERFVWLTHSAAGTEYLLLVGAGEVKLYDGGSNPWTHESAEFEFTQADPQHTGSGTPPQVVFDTSSISYAFKSGSRTWYVEGDRMDAYYTAPSAAWGELKRVSLSGVFRRGGSVLFGATWSTATGAGIDDKAVFVTTRGEVAVYSGDPADDDFGLEALYYVGEPLSRHAHAQVAGDLLIATFLGVVGLNETKGAGGNNPVALAPSSLSSQIERHWQDALALNPAGDSWRMLAWPSQNVAFIYATAAPDNDDPRTFIYAVNLETSAWCTISNWDVQAMAVLAEDLYFSDSSGNVERAWVGGRDGDQPIYCSAVLSPTDFGTARDKVLRTVTAVADVIERVDMSLGIVTNLNDNLSYPGEPTYEDGGSTWAEWSDDGWGALPDWGHSEYSSENPLKVTRQLSNVKAGSEVSVMPYVTTVVNSDGRPRLNFRYLELDYSVSAGPREVDTV